MGRKRTEQSFLVSKDEIATNDYDLSINKYKEVEYEKIHYDTPSAILNRLDGLQAEIDRAMGELRGLI